MSNDACRQAIALFLPNVDLVCWSLTLVCSFKHSLQLALQK